jgi:hypothetical protein
LLDRNDMAVEGRVFDAAADGHAHQGSHCVAWFSFKSYNY